MIRKILPFLAVLMLGTWCLSQAQTPQTSPPPFRLTLSLQEFMKRVIDSAADNVWDSVKFEITADGAKEISPQTQAQWDEVIGNAATLTESANLLLIPGRALDTGPWSVATQRLMAAGEKAMHAAERHDTQALFDAGGEIYVACNECHRAYAKHLYK